MGCLQDARCGISDDHDIFVGPSGDVTDAVGAGVETAQPSNDEGYAYALALCFRLLPTDEAVAAGHRLVELVRGTGHTIATGFAGTPLILDALTRAGALEDAYDLLLQTQSPSWLYAVQMGATTIWERWDSALPDGTINPGEMTSFNHYAFGSIGDWMHRTIGGLESRAPGFRTVRIAPRPRRGLTHARTAHRSPYGLIEVAWRVEDEALLVEVALPEGVTATIDLEGREPEVAGPGIHRFEAPDPYSFDAPQLPSNPLRPML